LITKIPKFTEIALINDMSSHCDSGP